MREEENEPTERFTELASRGHLFGIVGVIYQEVLQGAASQAKFDYLAEYLESQRFYYPEDPVASYREAALLNFRYRCAGVTIRCAIDCLIAGIAIEHDLILLLNDSDFENMAKVIPELALA